jgi:hypothetical protein
MFILVMLSLQTTLKNHTKKAKNRYGKGLQTT